MVLSTFHGFALWASPAVTHGVSPLGTVGEHVEAFRLPPPLHIAYSFADALIHYFACLRPCISCIVCRPSHHLSSSAASTQRYSRLRRRRTASIEQPHKSTLASGGGAPCLTAGDARRVNPWKEDRENSDAGGVALQALREKLRWIGGGCCATPPVSESGFVYLPRVHPSGITRGYAWCVPSGDSG